MDYSVEVTEQLRAYLRKEEISQDDMYQRLLANGGRMSHAKMRSWFARGPARCRISLDDLPLIAKALDLNVWELLPKGGA